MTSPKLRIENLTKTFGDEVAVDGLSMMVDQGKLHSLLGPSGCGKTTTLRCVAGLERPDSGQIYIDDKLVSSPDDNIHVEPQNRDIGMVFQSYAIWPHMTVKENVIFPLSVRKIGTKEEREERVRTVLDQVGLGRYASNLATNLSGGQQQRVAIARSLVVEPELMLFDEPLSNLDAKLRRDMRLEIKQLYQELDMSVLYVTHAQDEAMFLSDKISVMLDGRIIEDGDPVSLHTDPQTFFGMNFMGQCNTYTGSISTVADDGVTVTTGIGEFQLDGVGADFRSKDDVYVCFRPKDCSLVTDESPADHSAFVFGGTVEMRAATRDFIEYQVDMDGSSLLIRTVDPRPLTAGDQIQFSIDPADVKVFDDEEGNLVVEAGQADVADALPEAQTG